MPRYDVECTRCLKRVEVTARNLEEIPPCACGGSQIWVPSCYVAVFTPFMHPNLGDEPVEITSWKHYKSVLEERGLKNELAS